MSDTIIVIQPSAPVIIETAAADPVVIEAAGPQGPPGPSDALRIPNRLAEFDTPQAKVAARINLELQAIDCGVFT